MNGREWSRGFSLVAGEWVLFLSYPPPEQSYRLSSALALMYLCSVESVSPLGLRIPLTTAVVADVSCACSLFQC